MSRPWTLALLVPLVLYLAALGSATYGGPNVLHAPPPSQIDFWAAVFGLIAVYYEVPASWLNWPVGLVAVTLVGISCYDHEYYANAWLYLVVYNATGLLGWIWWTRGAGHTPKPIRRTCPLLWGGMVLAIAVLLYPATLFLVRVGGAQSWLDSLTTLLSLAGQYLLMRKAVETWWFWLVANSLYIYFYWKGGQPLLAQLSLVWLILTVAGWINWERELRISATMKTT